MNADMNNLSRVIANIFAPLSHAEKMRVNLDTEQVFDGADGQPEHRDCIGCGTKTRHSHKLTNGDVVALCSGCVLNGVAQELAGESLRQQCVKCGQPAMRIHAMPHGTQIALCEQCSVPGQLAVTVARIPIRAELQNILAAAEAYEHNARAHDEAAERLRTLAKEAREQAQNLAKVANL